MNPVAEKVPDLILEVDKVFEFSDIASNDPEELEQITQAIEKKKREKKEAQAAQSKDAK